MTRAGNTEKTERVQMCAAPFSFDKLSSCIISVYVHGRSLICFFVFGREAKTRESGETKRKGKLRNNDKLTERKHTPIKIERRVAPDEPK